MAPRRILPKMNLISDWQTFPPHLRGGVLCVGNFDGVHAGHRQMLTTGRDEAKRRTIPFTILTFNPHPATILRPATIRHPLTTLEQRQELLADFNPDAIVVVPTTQEFLAQDDDTFLQSVVRDAIGARVMVEGPSFTFGRGAKGNIETLKTKGPALGIETVVVPTEQVSLSDLTLVGVSSSLIRWLVENGRVADAQKCLARPYTLRGQVVRGEQRGRAIGYPTANIATPQMLPAPGVYAGRAIVDGLPHIAAISVGTNPTFHATLTTVEAFLLDFNADLYGKIIDLQFVRWLRDMTAFGGTEPLIKQMARDVALTRETIQPKESA